MKQAALRITNHGQKAQCLVRVAALAGSIDEALTAVLVRKVLSIKESSPVSISITINGDTASEAIREVLTLAGSMGMVPGHRHVRGRTHGRIV